jgi:hypothetical protein
MPPPPPPPPPPAPGAPFGGLLPYGTPTIEQPGPPPPPTPTWTSGYQPYPTAQPRGPWRSTKALATAVTALFSLTTLSRFLLVRELDARRAAARDFIDNGHTRAQLARIARGDSRVSSASLISLALLVASGVVIAIWSHHTVRNSQELGRGVTDSPGWAAGSWFVPFASMVVPYRIVGSVMAASRREGEPARHPWSLWTWGLGFVGAGVLGLLHLHLDVSATRLEQLRADLDSQFNSVALATVLLLVANVGAVVAVRGLSARQDELAAARR